MDYWADVHQHACDILIRWASGLD